MAPIDNRMPAWPTRVVGGLARPDGARPRRGRALLEPRDDIALAAYPVPPLVNNIRNNGPDLIARIPPA